jgi:UDP-3-O-[3-hydroxymyristoyl] glucosamine N-acyltransferase
VIGEDVKIFPNCYIGDGVPHRPGLPHPRRGADPRQVHHRRNCVLHSGVVIGADGFGFVPDAQGEQIKWRRSAT